MVQGVDLPKFFWDRSWIVFVILKCPVTYSDRDWKMRTFGTWKMVRSFCFLIRYPPTRKPTIVNSLWRYPVSKERTGRFWEVEMLWWEPRLLTGRHQWSRKSKDVLILTFPGFQFRKCPVGLLGKILVRTKINVVSSSHRSEFFSTSGLSFHPRPRVPPFRTRTWTGRKLSEGTFRSGVRQPFVKTTEPGNLHVVNLLHTGVPESTGKGPCVRVRRSSRAQGWTRGRWRDPLAHEGRRGPSLDWPQWTVLLTRRKVSPFVS